MEREYRWELGEVSSIDTLLGTIKEQRSGYHKCEGSRCADPSHLPHRDVYIWDERPDGKYRAHHEKANGRTEWVCYYCEPSAELRHAYDGFEAAHDFIDGRGPFALSSLKIIPWPDRTVLIGTPKSGIGSTYLAWEKREAL
jgi:hypothetical protein